MDDSWEQLLARIHASERSAEEARAIIRARMDEATAELASWRDIEQQHRDEAAQARMAIKRLALDTYTIHGKTLGKRWGGVQLQFRPGLIVLHDRAAVMALDGLMLVHAETGEQIPLVTYEPVLNRAAIRAFIESQKPLHGDPAETPLTPAPDGWPGILILQTEDDPAAWVLQVPRDLTEQ